MNPFLNGPCSQISYLSRSALGLVIGTALIWGAAPARAQERPAPAPGVAAAPSFTPLPPPSLNFYGTPGLLDTPSAEMMPDGQFTSNYAWFGGQGRVNLSFQALPWLSASFRYTSINDLNLYGFSTYYDRGFDVRLRLLAEGRYRPALALGLQDFAGTGVYAAEYFVATKRFQTPALSHGGSPGRLKVSAGLGWGRLGSHGAIGSTGTRVPYDPASLSLIHI